MLYSKEVYTWARIARVVVGVAGVIAVLLAPFIGEELFGSLWGVEPLAYIGATLVIVGLGVTSLSYVLSGVAAGKSAGAGVDEATLERWSQVTQQYFELFDHDLGRPLRRILGKERELRAVLQSSGSVTAPAVEELLDEIERQTPSFRLMMSNVQVLVQLEAPDVPVRLQAVEPSEIVRRIVDRYISVAAQSQKEITWWTEPSEFGIVSSNSSAIEHVLTNLVDNAVRFATTHVEVKLSKNPTHFFIRVWEDGPGIAPQYVQHIFDRGWTPEVRGVKRRPAQAWDSS